MIMMLFVKSLHCSQCGGRMGDAAFGIAQGTGSDGT